MAGCLQMSMVSITKVKQSLVVVPGCISRVCPLTRLHLPSCSDISSIASSLTSTSFYYFLDFFHTFRSSRITFSLHLRHPTLHHTLHWCFHQRSCLPSTLPSHSIPRLESHFLLPCSSTVSLLSFAPSHALLRPFFNASFPSRTQHTFLRTMLSSTLSQRFYKRFPLFSRFPYLLHAFLRPFLNASFPSPHTLSSALCSPLRFPNASLNAFLYSHAFPIFLHAFLRPLLNASFPSPNTLSSALCSPLRFPNASLNASLYTQAFPISLLAFLRIYVSFYSLHTLFSSTLPIKLLTTLTLPLRTSLPDT